MAILIFPLGGAIFILRGNYLGFVIGTFLYQIHSILDGCDGEIARARQLESEQGKRIDNWCDHAATFLLAICLGIGLSRNLMLPDAWRTFYFAEGILVAVLLAANEIVLAGSHHVAENEPSDSALYPRHREMVAGISFLGATTIGWLVQLTKRDVAIFVFLLIAIIGRAQWILHLLAVFSVISLTLASKARFLRAS